MLVCLGLGLHSLPLPEDWHEMCFYIFKNYNVSTVDVIVEYIDVLL